MCVVLTLTLVTFDRLGRHFTRYNEHFEAASPIFLGKIFLGRRISLKRLEYTLFLGKVMFKRCCFLPNIQRNMLSYFRLIFWTEWLRNNRRSARIGRALGDGSNVTYIRTSHLGWPNGLAVDIRFRRIWWCDAMFDRYLSCS